MVAVDDRLCRAETSEKEMADTSILGGNDMFFYNLLVWFLVKGILVVFSLNCEWVAARPPILVKQIKTCLSWLRFHGSVLFRLPGCGIFVQPFIVGGD